MKKCIVFIYLPGCIMAVPAGVFTYDSALQQGYFQYGRKYLERENAQAVDPVALPLRRDLSGPIETNAGLFGALRDSSPDHWGRMVIARKNKVSVSEFDEFDFLVNADASRVGNLDFRLSLDDPEPQYVPPTFQVISELVEAADRLQRSLPISDEHQGMLNQGTSMGGARPKCTVKLEGDLWIAKLPAKDDAFNNARVEYATMTLAARCGIQIPNISTMGLPDGRDVLLVKRFDRETRPDRWTRHGFLSALSFMEWDEQARELFSYVSVSGRMRQMGLGLGSMKELYQRMAFNAFCRNTDDHPRNHGFLVKNGNLSLSPAYDIVPSAAKIGVGTEFSLAMEIGARGRHGTLENLLSKYGQFGLRPEEAKGLLFEMAKTVVDWKQHFHKSGVSDSEIDIFQGSFASPNLLGAMAVGDILPSPSSQGRTRPVKKSSSPGM
ncbi:MAG: type II toxin-antitoxin system HipA family toxin [Desulfobulbaceae bacterium]|nr:type II toxin-antitoxin system HipA family toxin [Desulfobulbaceae bacterium]